MAQKNNVCVISSVYQNRTVKIVYVNNLILVKKRQTNNFFSNSDRF